MRGCTQRACATPRFATCPSWNLRPTQWGQTCAERWKARRRPTTAASRPWQTSTSIRRRATTAPLRCWPILPGNSSSSHPTAPRPTTAAATASTASTITAWTKATRSEWPQLPRRKTSTTGLTAREPPTLSCSPTKRNSNRPSAPIPGLCCCTTGASPRNGATTTCRNTATRTTSPTRICPRSTSAAATPPPSWPRCAPIRRRKSRSWNSASKWRKPTIRSRRRK